MGEASRQRVEHVMGELEEDEGGHINVLEELVRRVLQLRGWRKTSIEAGAGRR